MHYTVKQYIDNAFLSSYFNLQKMTDQHKVCNVQDVIHFVITGDICLIFQMMILMKIPPYIPPAISDSFDNDNYECLRVVMKDI